MAAINKFDTSNFNENNPFNIPRLNSKVPGLFKDEFGGDVISKFVGLRAKLYCIKSCTKKVTKAKGVSKAITKRLDLYHYNRSLKRNKKFKSKINLIKAVKHTLYSQKVNKLVLDRSDDKRHILANQVNTLPWGHYSLT